MSEQIKKSLLIVSSLPRFYQELVNRTVSYQQLGNSIIKAIKAARAFRRVEQVSELSRILINIPIREFQLIAQYYLVWCDCRENKQRVESLERIIDQTRAYKAQALITRAAIEGRKGNIESEAYFYAEALKANPTISQRVDILKSLAVVKAKEGYHKQSLRDFDELLYLLKYTEPIIYYDCLNSYAVELGESGRIYEARNISRLVLASPFSFAYPEWQQTAEDLREASRSIVAINPSRYVPSNVLLMPEHEIDRLEPNQSGQPARVLDFEKRKKKMAKGKKNNGEKQREVIPLKDMFMKIMEAYTSDTTTDEERYKIYEAVMKVMRERKPPAPDDEHGA
jgi:tetratricopeptide (TPR) repeat protein